MAKLDTELGEYAKSLGIDLFAGADLSSAKEFIRVQGGQHVAGFPRAISLGIGLLDDVVNELHNHEDLVTISTYRGLYTARAACKRPAWMI